MRSSRSKSQTPAARRRERLTANLDIRIAPSMIADLRRVADLEGRSVADVVRRWLEHCLTRAIRRYERTGRWIVAFLTTQVIHHVHRVCII
jgi:hypothetical protein